MQQIMYELKQNLTCSYGFTQMIFELKGFVVFSSTGFESIFIDKLSLLTKVAVHMQSHESSRYPVT